MRRSTSLARLTDWASKMPPTTVALLKRAELPSSLPVLTMRRVPKYRARISCSPSDMPSPGNAVLFRPMMVLLCPL